jgi:membrane protein implicated in regulation of membrane protease activity
MSSDPEAHEPGEEVSVVRIDGATAVVTRVPTIGTADRP